MKFLSKFPICRYFSDIYCANSKSNSKQDSLRIKLANEIHKVDKNSRYLRKSEEIIRKYIYSLNSDNSSSSTVKEDSISQYWRTNSDELTQIRNFVGILQKAKENIQSTGFPYRIEQEEKSLEFFKSRNSSRNKDPKTLKLDQRTTSTENENYLIEADSDNSPNNTLYNLQLKTF